MLNMGYREIVFKVVCLFCLDRSSQHYSVVDQTEGEICRLFG